MSECKRMRNLLALRAEDWDAEEGPRIQAHLETCFDCAALARTYAEHDRLLGNIPAVSLTPLQREQLLSRIQQEKKRHKMRTISSSLLGAAALTLALVAFTLGLYALFSDENEPAVGAPSVLRPTETVEPRTTPETVVFNGEIGLYGEIFDPLLGERIPFAVGTPSPLDVDAPGQLQVPANISFTLIWQVVAPRSAEWRFFGHVLDNEGQLVLQSDTYVNWDEQSCTESEQGMTCLIYTSHDWDLPADLAPGFYSFVVGLYDPATGARAPITNPAEITPPQVTVGQFQVVPGTSDVEPAQVTLHLFSGRPDPNWTLTPAQETELKSRIDALPPTDEPYDTSGNLGYTGFGVLLPAGDGQQEQRVAVWKGIVRLETDSIVTLLADENRALELWLLETGSRFVDSEILDVVRAEFTPASPSGPSTPNPTILPTAAAPSDTVAPTSTSGPESFGGFAIYVIAEDLSPALLSQSDLGSLELEKQPILSSADILDYSPDTHEMRLTFAATERINELNVPTSGRGFVVAVDNEPVYAGAFWTLASSLTFDGVVIEVPLVDASARIQLGYPESLDLFRGEDPRADPRVLRSLNRPVNESRP